MLFNSYEFLIIFLPLFLLAYFSTSRHKTLVLTIGSYIFYMGWKPSGAILLLMCTSINYLLGKAIFNSSSSGFRKILCAVSVAADLSILSYFKYLGFFEGAINSIQGHQIIKPAEIALPIGISFFIFQCISYTVDIYRKRVNPTKNFLDFACYVSLFPHLVAGPILRYSLIESQLRNREHTANKFAEGVAFFIVGLSKKVLIADTLATAANQLFDGGALGAYSCWAGLIAYTLQIFYDFAGYSDMAVGLGRMLGFYIPQNFNSPYLSTSISDFWRRWHMTLSYWLRDFLYIPLGGSKKGKLRTYFNLFITMLLGGLWHGASWTFVFWGAYHGFFLAVERLLGDRNPLKRAPVFIQIMITNFIVMIGWAFFRSSSFPAAANVIKGLFTFSGGQHASGFMLSPAFFITTVIAVFALIKFENVFNKKWKFTPGVVIALLILFLASMSLALSQDYSPFLYFQF